MKEVFEELLSSDKYFGTSGMILVYFCIFDNDEPEASTFFSKQTIDFLREFCGWGVVRVE